MSTVKPAPPTPTVYPSILAMLASDDNDWEPCEARPPPSRDELKNALRTYPNAYDVKEAQVLLMTQAWMEQTAVVGECRQQLHSTRRWFDEQQALEY